MKITLTKEIKWVLGALGAVVAIVIIYYIWVSLTSIKDVKKNNELVEKANEEIDVNKLTLTPTQLDTLVDKLYRAMDGLGTDTDAVYNAFDMCQTRSDVMSLVARFGVKNGETLSEWLYGDLDQSEINHVNSILSSKNINYKF